MMDLNADAVVVFGGTNDYGRGDAPFGQIGDKSPDTFCGAVDRLMSILEERYTGKPIVFITPIRRLDDEYPSNSPTKKSDAKPLKAYVDAIIEIGKLHKCVIVENAYENFDIDSNAEGDRLKYIPDGLYLNDEGHREFAEYLYGVLKSVCN